MSRSRSYCFTSFKDTVLYDGDSINYICWGRETCPDTGKPHLQGYVEFPRGVTLSRAKAILRDPVVHLERRKGSQKQAIDYCRKDCNGDQSHLFFEFGERKQQGARRDIDLVRDIVKGGGGMRKILDEAVNYQTLCIAKVALTYMEVGRDEPPEVFWYWGATGTGKTRAVVDGTDPSELWFCNGPSAKGGKLWFDGYDAHPVAILDDFRPTWCGLSFLLRLLDRYRMKVEVKGGYRSWRPSKIYVTCPKPPSECYLEAGEDIAQLERRISVIKEFV